MENKKYFILFSLFFIFSASVFSNELGQFYLEPHLTPWGLDTDFCLRLEPGFFEGRDTILRLTMGSSINWLGYYRDENDIYTDERELNYQYTRLNANWGLGIEQGLLWDSYNERNLLSLFLRYRGVRVWNFDMFDQDSILFDSIRPDKDGILYNTFIISLILDKTLINNETGLKKGVYSELSVEIGPKWFFNDIESIADFSKLFMAVKYFHSIYETADEDKFIKAIYLGDSVGADYVLGDNIPLPARQTFGVRKPKNACGGMVRAFEKRRFDSEIKIINNFECRFIMSQIKTSKGTKIFRPGFLGFFDSCYFDKLEGYKNDGRGVLMSAGFAVFSEFLFLGNCMLTVGFPIIGKRIDESPMAFSLDYGLHF